MRKKCLWLLSLQYWLSLLPTLKTRSFSFSYFGCFSLVFWYNALVHVCQHSALDPEITPACTSVQTISAQHFINMVYNTESSDSAAFWVFWRADMIGPFCEHSIASVIVSGLGTSLWAESHFGPVAGSSFPQAPVHFHPCNSFSKEQWWVSDVTVGCQTHPSLYTFNYQKP